MRSHTKTIWLRWLRVEESACVYALFSLSWLSTVSPTRTFLDQILPYSYLSLSPSSIIISPPSLLNRHSVTSSSLVRDCEFVTLLTHREPEQGGEERRDSPSLNISKGSDPQHDPIICPQPLILHFTLSGVLSQGPRWLLFPLSLMGIRDSSLPEVLIAAAAPLSTDFKSTQHQAWQIRKHGLCHSVRRREVQ